MTDIEHHHDHLEDTVLKLSDYLQAVELVVKETFKHQVWVKAEIRNLSTKGGHYYFELAEKDESGKIIASCRGNLWSYKADTVLKKFAKSTGMQLARDLTVMIKVTANLHPQYGFSLTILDIDPHYTMGDLARQYTAMLDRLVGEGLTQANKTIQMPLDVYNVVVIAPEGAAGLGDFRAEADKLHKHNACKFHYSHATFQGNHAPKEIRHAILSAVQEIEEQIQALPDLMVIIRGGGAVGDLGYLNDYELAALVAEQQMPVWVGIGHERDKGILDEVAHTSFDTPSKVISGIIHHLRNLVEQTQAYRDTIESISRQQVQLMSLHNDKYLANIKKISAVQLSDMYRLTNQYMITVERRAKNQLSETRMSNESYIQHIKQQSKLQLQQASGQTKTHRQHIEMFAKNSLRQAQQDSNHLRETILLQSPLRVLQQGYAIAKDVNSNKVLTSTEQLSSWQEITLDLKDGLATAVIKHVEKSIEVTQ